MFPMPSGAAQRPLWPHVFSGPLTDQNLHGLARSTDPRPIQDPLSKLSSLNAPLQGIVPCATSTSMHPAYTASQAADFSQRRSASSQVDVDVASCSMAQPAPNQLEIAQALHSLQSHNQLLQALQSQTAQLQQYICAQMKPSDASTQARHNPAQFAHNEGVASELPPEHLRSWTGARAEFRETPPQTCSHTDRADPATGSIKRVPVTEEKGKSAYSSTATTNASEVRDSALAHRVDDSSSYPS